MPGETTVRRWLRDHEEFRREYARARELQADHYADEIVKIADECDSKNGREVEKARLRIDARKWHMSKTAPKKYGERQHLEHSGELTLTDLIRESYKPRELVDVTPEQKALEAPRDGAEFIAGELSGDMKVGARR